MMINLTYEVDTMEFCKKCGAMIFHGTLCDKCGFNISLPVFENFKIGIPDEYISDKENFKNDSNSILKLIINKDQFSLKKEDISSHASKIIDSANKNFINKEKREIKRSFNQYLNSQKDFINHNVRSSLKSKFNREYFDYYDDLDFDSRIDEFNQRIINREKKQILNSFNQYLDSQKDVINDDVKLSFKSKYTKEYFDFYDDLDFDSRIDEFNKKILADKKDEILSLFPDKYISHSEIKEIQIKNNLKFNIDDFITEHNDNFIKRQLKTDQDYFDNFLGKSLDKNQRIAVLTDDDATQIVAGAGTGKTLTIQAKVKYLLDKKGIKPEDILCISFSNSASEDLADKLDNTIGNAPVEVRTFHSLGFKILGNNGYGRDVPDYEISHLIDKYFRNSLTDNSEFVREVCEFFAYYFNLIHMGSDNLKLETIKSRMHSFDEYDEYLSEYLDVNNDRRNKEYMGDVKELIVANYLYIHNINYEYSRQLKVKDKNYDEYITKYFKLLYGNMDNCIPYDLKLQFIEDFHEDFACKIFDEYPSFFIPDWDIYIDLESSSLKDIQNLNKSNKTKLFDLSDANDVEILLKELQDNLLKYNVEIDAMDYTILFEKLISESNPEFKRFKKTIGSFINLFKGNAINIDDDGNDISENVFQGFIKENHEKYSYSIEKRNKFFLEIIEKIYQYYVLDLKDNNYIDFNDMINDAVVKLRNGAYVHKYKYVIVDEYQDTSHTRYNLLKELQNATGAKIVVVGDDWQSIYGFTGCDVNLFSNFNQYFEDSKMVKIDVTRRNSQKLIDIAGNFIKKNKNQIPKKLRSVKIENKHPIKLFQYVSRAEEVLGLIKILDEISKEKSDASVLILGRNNRDINEISCRKLFKVKKSQDFTKIDYAYLPKLNIKFRTVHKSKGLEADYVIVLNLNNQINGFPNKIVNDPVLDFVNNIQNEGIEYPEERRLFYVALTRTRNDVYLFANQTHPSIFFKEIKYENGVELLDYVFSNDDIIYINSLLEKRFEVIETEHYCPKCRKGKVNLIVNNERGTSYFRCSNFCGWGVKYHNKKYDDGTRKIQYIKYAEVCPKCDGMLIVIRNRIDGTYFLGCTSYNTTGCRETSELPDDFDVHLGEDIVFRLTNKINTTRSGVYYIDEYVPPKKQDLHDEHHNNFSRQLLGFKNGNNDLINLFTKDIVEFISKLSNQNIDNSKSKLALIAVPSSKTYKTNNSIKKTIDIIEEFFKQGTLKSDFNLNKDIVNYKDLLKRKKDVPTAHLGEGRASFDEHIDSIECIQDNLSNKDTVYIILDDITTTGNSMRACNQILSNNGVKEENIINIALGATVRDDDGEI